MTPSKDNLIFAVRATLRLCVQKNVPSKRILGKEPSRRDGVFLLSAQQGTFPPSSLRTELEGRLRVGLRLRFQGGDGPFLYNPHLSRPENPA